MASTDLPAVTVTAVTGIDLADVDATESVDFTVAASANVATKSLDLCKVFVMASVELAELPLIEFAGFKVTESYDKETELVDLLVMTVRGLDVSATAVVGSVTATAETSEGWSAVVLLEVNFTSSLLAAEASDVFTDTRLVDTASLTPNDADGAGATTAITVEDPVTLVTEVVELVVLVVMDVVTLATVAMTTDEGIVTDVTDMDAVVMVT